MFSYKEARKYTKEHIAGKTGKILGYLILFYILRGLITGTINQIDSGTFGILLSAAAIGVITPIQVGFYRIITNIMNGKEVSAGMLFDDYKHFLNLFVIGFVFNLVITFGYKVYIVGILLDYIYVGVLYYFIYNSDLSLGEFFGKLFDKIKSYFSECIILELSYYWPFLVAAILYAIVAVIFFAIFAVGNINKLQEIVNMIETTSTTNLSIITSLIPLLVLTIVFIIVIFIMFIMIVPRCLFAEAKFYSVFGNENNSKEEKKSENNFCPNCGSKIEGKFCTNCGTKIKE